MGAKDKEAAASQPPTLQTPQTELKLTDLMDYLTGVSMRLIDFENLMKSLEVDEIQNKYNTISKEVEEISDQLGPQTFTPRFDYNQLSIFTLKLQREQIISEIDSRSLSERIDTLEDLNNSWSLEKQKLASWHEQAAKKASFMMYTQEISDLQNKVDAVLQSIAKELEPTLAASQKIRTIQLQIHSLNAQIDSRTETLHKREIHQITPSVLSAEFYAQMFDHGLWQAALRNSITFFVLQRQIIPEHQDVLLVMAIVIAVFSLIIYRSRPFIKASMAWYPLTLRPVATASFICLTLLVISDILIPNFPAHWDMIIKLFLLLAILRLTLVLIDAPGKRKEIYQLSLFVLTFHLANQAKIPPSCIYFFIFSAASTGILYGLWLLRRSQWSETILLGRWTTWMLIMFLALFYWYSCSPVIMRFPFTSSSLSWPQWFWRWISGYFSW